MEPIDPDVKRAADKVYQTDRQKFQKLIIWLRAAQHTYSTEVIVATLERFEPYAASVDSGWWQYLDKLLDQQEGKINGRKAEAESEQHKKEDMGQFGAIMDRIRAGKGLP
jgi:hypothetical protein